MINILGEAMALRPMVLMAAEILKTPGLKTKYGAQAEQYLALSEKVFEKWDTRSCWREVKEGGLWVVPPFGIDQKTGRWTDRYARRNTEGFSLPTNKQNLIAGWLMAMYDATHKTVYRERAEKWWRLMKTRFRLSAGGKYYVWIYYPIMPLSIKLCKIRGFCIVGVENIFRIPMDARRGGDFGALTP